VRAEEGRGAARAVGARAVVRPRPLQPRSLFLLQRPRVAALIPPPPKLHIELLAHARLLLRGGGAQRLALLLLEQVADGESGFLVPPSDPVALADKLEVLLRDPALCARFGAEGRRRIDELFTLNGMVENIVRVYEDCLADTR
jgi:hypothetical protein